MIKVTKVHPDYLGAELGLRPGTELLSVGGRELEYENLVVATGHKRAGLHLSPATAELVADLVLGRSPRIDLSPFRPGREPGAPGDDAFRS